MNTPRRLSSAASPVGGIRIDVRIGGVTGDFDGPPELFALILGGCMQFMSHWRGIEHTFECAQQSGRHD